MFIPTQIIESMPVAVSCNQNTPFQQPSAPTQTWNSVQLASSTRPGIPGGNDVPPFRLKTSKIAQAKNLPGVVIDRMYVIDMLGSARGTVEADGKVDPLLLPSLKANVLPNGVQLTWQPVSKAKIRQQRRSTIDEYKIFRNEFSKDIFLISPRDEEYGSTFIGKSNTESFLDKSAIKGHRYVYIVMTNSVIPNFFEHPSEYSYFWDSTPLIEVPK